jgi:UDP-N-acetyl-D-mannosaminuronate dehydrogenase
MADVGFKVHGVEVRDSVLVQLTHGRAHFHEPGLEEKLQQVINAGNFHFSQEIPTDWIVSVYSPST